MNDFTNSVYRSGGMIDPAEDPRGEPEFTPEELEKMAAQDERELGVADDETCRIVSRDYLGISDDKSEGTAVRVEQRLIETNVRPVITEDYENGSTVSSSEPDFPPTPETTGIPIIKPGARAIRPSPSVAKLGNFSNLTILNEALRRIEAQNIDAEDSVAESVIAARVAVVTAIENAYYSRFNLGEALNRYKVHFKAKRGWIKAAKVIGKFMNRDEKTVRNIIADYERVLAALPASVIEIATARRIDLACKKFGPTVKTIEAKIGPDDVIDAEKATEILDSVIPIKPAKSKPGLEEFAKQTAQSFQKKFKGISSKALKVEVEYTFEVINATLGSQVRALSQYDRPEEVPMPSPNKGGVARP